MSLEKSQKIVKVLGILDIIAAVLCVLGAVGMFGMGAAGGMGAVNAADQTLSESDIALGVASFWGVGILMLGSGIVDLLNGIFALRAAKDASKVMPLWVMSIIGIVGSVVNLIGNFSQGGQAIVTGIISVAISCGLFYLANNIKKLGGR